MRAVEGDLVASSLPPVEGYEAYCRDFLGLGTARWLCPRSGEKPAELAAALWQDEHTRDALLAALDAGRWRSTRIRATPGSGNWRRCWMRQVPGRVHVVAPLPKITAWANHKCEFIQIVRELFGEALVPCTRSAASLALAAEAVRDLAPRRSGSC